MPSGRAECMTVAPCVATNMILHEQPSMSIGSSTGLTQYEPGELLSWSHEMEKPKPMSMEGVHCLVRREDARIPTVGSTFHLTP